MPSRRRTERHGDGKSRPRQMEKLAAKSAAIYDVGRHTGELLDADPSSS